ncbi:helix-turn-helix domain-containing protein [Chloroflexales bacterium ZM16-3]|nr:helix-turn-helix domain-containing protein [Chloroflexales bacterium ZM16-3]
MSDDTDLITTTDAAAQLGRSMSTINQLIKRGDLVGRRIGPDTRGGQWLVSAASVAALAARWAANPPRRGRPAAAAPSESTLAKRRSRARQTEEGAA